MKAKLQDIQALRGVAIAMVLLQHLSLLPSLGSNLKLPINMPFYSGVELFFVISGFVVTRSILFGGGGAGDFLLRRALRLYPAIFVFLLLSFGINSWNGWLKVSNSFAPTLIAAPGEFWRQATAIVSGVLINYSVLTDRPAIYLNGAMWSLSVEFQFYAAGAVGLALIGIRRRRLIDIKRTAIGVAAIILALSVISRLLWGVPEWFLLNYLIAFNFDFLLAGVCIALGWGELPATWREFVSRWAFAGALVMLIATAFFPSPLIADETRSRLIMPLMILGYAGIVAAGSDERAFAWKGPIYRSMIWLGERSYSVYLFHFPVMAAIWFGLVRFASPIWTAEPLHYGIAQTALALLIVLPLSSWSLRWVENPARRLHWRRKTSSTAPKAALAADVS
jgi:peptidoglycan/LPS O-acetylase OafA/YrhL